MPPAPARGASTPADPEPEAAQTVAAPQAAGAQPPRSADADAEDSDLVALGIDAPGPRIAPPPAPEAPPRDVRETVDRIRKLLGAPTYITRRELRVQRVERTRDELLQSRFAALEARKGLLAQLRQLSADPARFAAVKTSFGAARWTEAEAEIRRIFSGGPGAEDVDRAIELWRSAPSR